MTVQPWESISAKKRQALAQAIPPEWLIPADILPPDDQADVTTFLHESGWFTDRELEILDTPSQKILAEIASQSWTSEEVTRAFCKAAAAAQQLINCLTDFFFEEAITQAKELDESLRTTGTIKGPFHGLPISIKDNFNMIGKDSTIGLASLADQPATSNSVLVDILVKAGAVLYVKTNIPTAMMMGESVNHVFGRTVSPLNRNMTSGGSSGGESALVAFGGSRLGVGTDIGGSLRIPAACTGIFTIRPSFGRFPSALVRAGLAGQESIVSVAGPMARTLDEIVFWSKTVIDYAPWLLDPKCLPIPWRTVQLPQRLRIGVLWHDGIVAPTPPVARALKEVTGKLEKAGHEVVTWKNTDYIELLTVTGRMFLADGGKSIKKLLEPTGEPFPAEMKPFEAAQEIGVHDLWQLHVERTRLAQAFLNRWNESGIDAILCPTTPYSSAPNGKFAYGGYTTIFNALDYSAVSFPCGVHADREVDAPYADHKSLSELDTKVQSDYDAQAVHGAPVSLQLVGRRLEEEKVLAMTDVILQAISKASDCNGLAELCR